MTNPEIIKKAADEKGFEYDGNNLFTYHEWLKRGYQVKKGEKAFLKLKLWQYKQMFNEETKQNEEKQYLVNAHLFSPEQVKPIEQEETAHAPTKVCGLS